MVVQFFKEKRYLIISILLIALMPSYRSCNLQEPDVISYGFPFYILEGNWAGVLPNYNQLFWFGLVLNILVIGTLYFGLYYKLDKKNFSKFVKGFSLIPLYLVFTGFLWFLEKYTLGTSFHLLFQSVSIFFRVPAMFFYSLGEAMMNMGRDSIISFFNFGVGVSSDGAMRAIVLLFSLGIGSLWALKPEEEKDKISLSNK